MAKIGFLDSIEDGLIRGWAFDETSESPAMVDVFIGGTLIATIECSEFRTDLAEAHIGDGWHGFSHRLPRQYDKCGGVLTASFAGGGPVLTNGDRVLPSLTYRLLLSSVLAKGSWCIDHLSLSDAELTIDGWCVPPRAIPVPVGLNHNGERMQLTRHRRNDIAVMLGLDCDEIGFGFRARSTLSKASRSHDLCFVHASTKSPFDDNQTIHFIVVDNPLPPEKLRLRVHGSGDAESFVREGSTAFGRLQRVLGDYFSKSITDFGHVLDWGCGSGRVLRYFAPTATETQVTGIDIDPEAIQWCRRAFPRSRFMAVGTEPPTPIPSETFDLIYSISVLTHLSEKDHIKWLEELHRLSKPSAVVLLTTLGDSCWWRSRRPWNLFATWKTDDSGFFDGGRNSDLDQLKIDHDYYRNVFVSHDYIMRNWSRYFEIVDILPAAIGNLQDLTILLRR